MPAQEKEISCQYLPRRPYRCKIEEIRHDVHLLQRKRQTQTSKHFLGVIIGSNSWQEQATKEIATLDASIERLDAKSAEIMGDLCEGCPLLLD